jgi:hypothetical protein
MEPEFNAKKGSMVTEREPFVAAVAEGDRQAYERLSELEVKSAGVPWGGTPSMSASALAQLQQEGAAATLDAYERLNDSAGVDTLVDVARSLAAAPWDRGVMRDQVEQDLRTYASLKQLSVSGLEVRDTPDSREVYGTASWVHRQSDMERVKAMAGREPADDDHAGRTSDLDPALQRIVDLNKLDHPTNAIRSSEPGHSTSHRATSAIHQSVEVDRGYGRRHA